MSFAPLLRWLPLGFERRQKARRRPASPGVSIVPRLEVLEDRTLPSTFTVSNLFDSGAGSLRQAILDANDAGGADVIDFTVAGTVRLTSGALPAVSGQVDIDGATAPRFAGRPVVEIDYNGFGGIWFNTGSGGSTLRSLGHVNAAGDGITLDAGSITVVGNFVGLRLDGKTVAANAGNGLMINAASSANIVGRIPLQDRNVISGNLGHGIVIDGALGNLVRNNVIGADADGTKDRGNGGNGIVLTNFARENYIGGVATAEPPGTKPDNFSGIKPPEGNLISANDGNGVLLTGGARDNYLEGNFIGTALTGVHPLGNALDGVAIVNAPGNALLGTFDHIDPFIFYNVVSGNAGNGLRVRDSNGTVIHANFFGLGSDDQTPLGNGQNGVLIEGSSTNTVLGGPIPLGNVISANRENGVVVRDTAGGFLSENTFCGVAAFSRKTNLGNGQDGFLITATGGDIVIKIGNIISRNGDDGIEISGNARDVQAVQNMIGLDTSGFLARGNADNGIEIGGNAHDIVVGGAQPDFSIVPTGTISANGGYGVAVLGTAYDNQINFSYIGTDSHGRAGDSVILGNIKGGVFLGPGTRSTTIGSTDSSLHTVISGNRGDGITMSGTIANVVIGTRIGADTDGNALRNHGNGILIQNSSNNLIGGTIAGAGNIIAFNHRNGVFVESGQRNTLRQNSIYDNHGLGILLGPGANADQAAPVLTSAVSVLGGIQIFGTLTSTPGTTFTIELFASTSDGSRPAQGQTFLAAVTVTTDEFGFASFNLIVSPAAGASVLTATATDPLGNTSEFSDGLLLQESLLLQLAKKSRT